MSANDPVELALTRRPSDEREYCERLQPLTETGGLQPERVRPRVGVGGSRGGHLLPRLAAVALVLVVAAGVIGSLALRNVGPVGPTGSDTSALPEQLIGCWGQEPGFYPSALAGTGNAEASDIPAAAVLRWFAGAVDQSGYPLHGWHLVYSTSDEFYYLARGEDPGETGYRQVVIKRGTSGQFAVGAWSVASYGSCVLRTIPPPGYGPATWTLDPAYQFASSDAELHILVDETACHGSQPSAYDRIRADVAYGTTSVVVTVSVRLPEGAQDCLKPPPAAYVVELNEPLGARGLFDGDPWPETAIVRGEMEPPTPTPQPSLTPAPRTPVVTTEKVTDACHSASCNWTIEIDKPVVSGPATSALMNDQIDVAVRAWIDGFKIDVGTDVENERSLSGTYSVALASPSLLSLQFALDEDTGGVFTAPHGLNFGVADGKLIALNELFSDQPAALVLLSSESRRLLPGVLSEAAGAPLGPDEVAQIEAGTGPALSNFNKAWVFTPEGLQIAFETAQVAGRWASTPTIVIPWASLAGVIDTSGPAGEFVGGGPTPAAERTFQLYQVKPGDTMHGIATMFGLSLAQLLAANPQIKDPSHLEVGQAIYIPWQTWVPPVG